MHDRTSRPFISLVIPLYNESDRFSIIPPTMQAFDTAWGAEYEVILVDDGSTDGTWELMKAYQSNHDLRHCQMRIEHQENGGKGLALYKGIQLAAGHHVLTLDADMAAKPMDVIRWLDITGDFDSNTVYVGSRLHPDADLTAKKSRQFAGQIFRWLCRSIIDTGIDDTQCGFKLYPTQAAKEVFSQLSSYGWAHDVEVLYRFRRRGAQLLSMPVRWQHMEGSKIHVLSDGVGMLRQLIAIRKAVHRM